MKIKSFLRILPQIFVASLYTIVSFNEGMGSAFPIILIPILSGNSSDIINQNETIHLTPDETSWLGSVSSIVKPIGCIVGAFLADLIGRKISLFVTTIPSLIGWIMMSFASTGAEVFIADALFGISKSATDTVEAAYVGEIYEPSVRTVLITLSTITTGTGSAVVSLLSSLVDWRHVALYCLIVPILISVVLCLLPESPYWLLGKQRRVDAMESLKWLRRWVPSDEVACEFNEIENYQKMSQLCAICTGAKQNCDHSQPTFMEKLREMKELSTLRPLIILTLLTFFVTFNGSGTRVYAIQIVEAFGSPFDGKNYNAVLSMIMTFATFFYMPAVKFSGKRKQYIFGNFGATACCLTLGIYGMMNSPSNITSFDVISRNSQPMQENYYGVSLFTFRYFSTLISHFACANMFCELFPLKTRSFAIGLMFIIRYFFESIATKLHFNFEVWLTLWGTFFLYAAVALIGLIFAYLLMPETENRSLEEIEKHFSDENHKWTDRHIKTEN